MGESEAELLSTVAVATKDAPANLVRKAIGALGGMQTFVKKGGRVVVKPNLAFARRPEIAATTNPEVVSEVVRLCFGAGAKEVLVLDYPVDSPRIAYEMSGVAQAVAPLGATMVTVSRWDFMPLEVPKGRILSAYEVKVLKHVLQADVLINVAIAKTHSAATLTLGLKNLMGVIQDRGAWHDSSDLHQCIADVATAVKPHLTIIDAVRILTSNGPKGPGRVEEKGTVIAGTDIVVADAFATTLYSSWVNGIVCPFEPPAMNDLQSQNILKLIGHSTQLDIDLSPIIPHISRPLSPTKWSDRGSSNGFDLIKILQC